MRASISGDLGTLRVQIKLVELQDPVHHLLVVVVHKGSGSPRQCARGSTMYLMALSGPAGEDQFLSSSCDSATPDKDIHHVPRHEDIVQATVLL